MKKLLVLVVAVMFSVGAFANGAKAGSDAKAKTDKTEKTEKSAALTPDEIQTKIDEKKAALEAETDKTKKAALEKEIKDLEKSLPKKKDEKKSKSKKSDSDKSDSGN